MPLFEVPFKREIRPKRYRYGYLDDHSTATQRLEWHEPRSPNTKAYEHWLLRILIHATVSDVAKKRDVSEDIVSGTIDR